MDITEGENGDEKTTGITKRFWSYIKSKRKDAAGIGILQRPDGTETIDAKEKANILKEQYESVFTLENPTLPVLDPCNTPSLPRINVTTPGIVKQLKGLNPRKSSGPDGISSRILKETAIEVAPYLQIVFQKSIDTGCVPEDWKRANITAIYKKGKRELASNYRPVSLTPITCKILEHIIFHAIMKHLDEHKILVDYQHGFRKHHSCETQLISTLETITKSFDEKKQTDLIILDFSKAFDTVPHLRLLQKLEHYGVRNISNNETDSEQNILTWFGNWLCGRTQQVILDGETSDSGAVISGVPQGTVLGPLCFLIFINDLGKTLSENTNLKLFADDSLLFREITSAEEAEELQNDLDALIKWTTEWHMKFHPAKCQVMSIHRSKTHVIHDYKIANETLNRVNSTRYLGIEINDQLKWDNHINNIISKANKTLGFIRRNLHMCPYKIKEQAYRALVRPTLEYASSVWDPYHTSKITKIEKVQRRAARFVTNCNSTEKGCVTKALQQLKWPTLEQRRKHSRLSTMFNTINYENSPLTIPAHFRPTQQRYATRNYHSSKFTNPQTNTETYRQSFFARTIREWGQLPPVALDRLFQSSSTQNL